jgi:hypothetical protein
MFTEHSDYIDCSLLAGSIHCWTNITELAVCCFTYALLQTCTSNDKERLNAILNFIKTEHIKLDEEIILSFDTKSIQVNTFKLLVATVKDYELIDVNVLMKIVIALDALFTAASRSNIVWSNLSNSNLTISVWPHSHTVSINDCISQTDISKCSQNTD